MREIDEVAAQVQNILQPFIKTGATVSEDSDLVDELGLNSLQVMELIEVIEDRFDISFPLNNLPDIRTVGDLVQQLQHLTDR